MRRTWLAAVVLLPFVGLGRLDVKVEDLVRERPRIRLELENMYGGIPSLAATNFARMLAAGDYKVCPRPGGYEESIDRISLGTVRERVASLYRANHVTIA